MMAASGGLAGALTILYLLLHRAFLQKKSVFTSGQSPQFNRTRDLDVTKDQGDRKGSLCLGKIAVITGKSVKAGNREGHVLVLWERFEVQDCLSAIRQLFIGSPLWRCLCSLA